MKNKQFIAIDLKSFYASVECMERNLDPMTTNLVVADGSRTEKTICLAVSPSLKTIGVGGRPRLFEVVQKVKEKNYERARTVYGGKLEGSSYDYLALCKDNKLAIDYIVAPPRMAHYIEYSTRIFDVYLKYVAREDIHVYSIDEVFMDVTAYLKTYKMTATELARTMIQDVYHTTGITATAGIGTNMYLAKIAMDIVAKKTKADKYGVRIAELDEMSYRQLLWAHTPITDFWRVGKGYAKRLAEQRLYTMGDIARCSLGNENDYYNEALLYKMFGINAELLIDHAWGYEPSEIADIKAYKPEHSSICSGQVLQDPYDYKSARLVLKEMVDNMCLDLVAKGVVTNQIVLTVGYDIENLTNSAISKSYKGEIAMDTYGRKIPKHAHGTTNFSKHTSSTKLITKAVTDLYDRIINKILLIRRLNMSVNNVVYESDLTTSTKPQQMDFFGSIVNENNENESQVLERERNAQKALIEIKKKYGKNAILKGMNLEEGATAKDRNRQIGGHKA